MNILSKNNYFVTFLVFHLRSSLRFVPESLHHGYVSQLFSVKGGQDEKKCQKHWRIFWLNILERGSM